MSLQLFHLMRVEGWPEKERKNLLDHHEEDNDGQKNGKENTNIVFDGNSKVNVSQTRAQIQ